MTTVPQKPNTEIDKRIATFLGLVKEDPNFKSGKSIEFVPGAFTDYDAYISGANYIDNAEVLLRVVDKINAITDETMAFVFSVFIDPNQFRVSKYDSEGEPIEFYTTCSYGHNMQTMIYWGINEFLKKYLNKSHE